MNMIQPTGNTGSSHLRLEDSIASGLQQVSFCLKRKNNGSNLAVWGFSTFIKQTIYFSMSFPTHNVRVLNVHFSKQAGQHASVLFLQSTRIGVAIIAHGI